MPRSGANYYDEDPGGDEFHKGHAQRRRSTSACPSCGGGGCMMCGGLGNIRTPTPSSYHGAAENPPGAYDPGYRTKE